MKRATPYLVKHAVKGASAAAAASMKRSRSASASSSSSSSSSRRALTLSSRHAHSGTSPSDVKDEHTQQQQHRTGGGRGGAHHGKPVAAFIFRRDFRLHDNTALIKLCHAATRASLPVLPLFFFNPVQCDAKLNAYFSPHCFRFMCESLVQLDTDQLDGRLVCLRGEDEVCLRHIAKSGLDVVMIGFNEDYTPFAMTRDERLSAYCDAHHIECVKDNTDFTVLPLNEVVTSSGHPYSVFTPFSRRLLDDFATRIRRVDTTQFAVASTFLADGKRLLGEHCIDPAVLCPKMELCTDFGGRVEGLKRVKGIERLHDYAVERDYIALDKTAHLSPHIKYGTVSIREVWHKAVRTLGLHHAFVRQLIWHEFYAVLIYHYPRLVQGQLNVYHPNEKPKLNAPFQSKYEAFKWDWDPAHYAAFKQGMTGVPLVDAGVRCLTATGWCHNRCRLVLGGFLVKVLGVDWREGERWYATVAVDYDVANNSGSWLWTAGQGADPQPYFRSFSAFRHSQRFDADCQFIKQWVPELRDVPPHIIHTWDVYCAKYRNNNNNNKGDNKGDKDGGTTRKRGRKVPVIETTYPSPIVDIRARTRAIIEQFKQYGEHHHGN